MKVLFLAPYPQSQAPSQRFRFELFLPLLQEQQITYDFQSFLSDQGWKVLYTQGNTLAKIGHTLAGFLRRAKVLFRLNKYQIIFIHRELTPLGPPIFEWIIARVLKKKIIYDFDDAIWIADAQGEGELWTFLKWRSKVASITKLSWKVSVGNEYLSDFASEHCSQTVIIPTVVDTEVHKPLLRQAQYDSRKNKFDALRQAQSDKQATSDTSEEKNRNNLKLQQPNHPITQSPNNPITQLKTIGWTGSHSTLAYLDSVLPILQELEKELSFNFLVIANKNPKLPLKHFQFIAWSEENEAADLAKIDIGIMPLKDDPWAQGKCGFKLIQYLAMEIPAIASPVGVNNKIIKNGVNGMIAHSPEEWKEHLKLLLNDDALRTQMGKKGRTFIEEHYSVKSLKPDFLRLFV